MKTIIVGSINQVKIDAARGGFSQVFPDEKFVATGMETISGVAAQPMTDSETLQGATNRAHATATANPNANYWVGIEGGIEETPLGISVFAWIVILSARGESSAKTGTFYLPPALSKLIKEGHELGAADDLFFGRTNSKQANGSVGILTNDLITRKSYYEHAVVLALIPELKPELWRL